MSDSKFTPDTREKILNAIQAGNYLTTAAAIAGIDRRTVYRWKKRGEEDINAGKTRTRWAKFVQDLDIAEGEGEFVLVQKVLQGGPKGALQILKRRFRDRWGDKISTEMSGPDGGPIPHQHSGGVTINFTTPESPDQPEFAVDEDCETATP